MTKMLYIQVKFQKGCDHLLFYGFDEEADTIVPVEADVENNKELAQNNQERYTDTVFESIKHINENGEECWYARELSKTLGYKDFRNFELTIFKAMDACQNSGNTISDHFGDFTEMVSIGSGAKRGFKSYILSRYACYLIVMNGDSSKTQLHLVKPILPSRHVNKS